MIFKPSIAYEKQWIFKDGSQPFQVRVMKADEIRRLAHVHKTMHEYFYIIQGMLKLSVDGKVIEMNADDLVVVEPGERHVVTWASKDLLLLLIMPPPVANDKLIC